MPDEQISKWAISFSDATIQDKINELKKYKGVLSEETKQILSALEKDLANTSERTRNNVSIIIPQGFAEEDIHQYEDYPFDSMSKEQSKNIKQCVFGQNITNQYNKVFQSIKQNTKNTLLEIKNEKNELKQKSYIRQLFAYLKSFIIDTNKTKKHKALKNILVNVERGVSRHSGSSFKKKPLKAIQPSKQLSSPEIILASAKRNTEKVEELLKKGVNVNTQDKAGSTALHFAVMNDDKKLVKLLLDHNADPNIKSQQGYIASDLTRQKQILTLLGAESQKEAQKLSKKQKEVKQVGKNSDNKLNVQNQKDAKKTSLIKAIVNHQELSQIKSLLENEFQDLNEQDPKTGHTPLHAAVLIDDIDLVKTLLDYGVDVTIRDNHGYGAADYDDSKGEIYNIIGTHFMNNCRIGSASFTKEDDVIDQKDQKEPTDLLSSKLESKPRVSSKKEQEEPTDLLSSKLESKPRVSSKKEQEEPITEKDNAILPPPPPLNNLTEKDNKPKVIKKKGEEPPQAPKSSMLQQLQQQNKQLRKISREDLQRVKKDDENKSLKDMADKFQNSPQMHHIEEIDQKKQEQDQKAREEDGVDENAWLNDSIVEGMPRYGRDDESNINNQSPEPNIGGNSTPEQKSSLTDKENNQLGEQDNHNPKPYAIYFAFSGVFVENPAIVQELFNSLLNKPKPVFPISGNDIKEIGINGEEIGKTMNYLKKIWIDSNFSLNKKNLTKMIKDFSF